MGDVQIVQSLEEQVFLLGIDCIARIVGQSAYLKFHPSMAASRSITSREQPVANFLFLYFPRALLPYRGHSWMAA